MTIINLRDLGVLSPRPLFQHLTMTIGEADRIGLVAGNGAGKTTLLRCLTGSIEPTTGEVVSSRGTVIGYVEQDVPTNLLNLPLAETIRRALPVAERESQAWRVDLVLDEFGAPREFRDRALRSLSGGWQRLALIARAWVAEPHMLLLDEPTNHLDLAKIQMLERWIAVAGRLPMVIASHDRQFLDACTTHTLFLRPDHCRSYARPYSRARVLLEQDDAAQQERIARDTREVNRLRRNARELTNVGINSGSDLLLKKSKQLRERAAKLEQALTVPKVQRPGDIRLGSRDTHAKLVLALQNVDVRTPRGEDLFRIRKLDVFQQDRIVVLGRNGVGKSQFVRLLHEAVRGRDVAGLRASTSIVVGYVDQPMSHLPDAATPLDFINSAFRPGDQRTVSLLAGAGISVDAQRRPIGMLSPGQKARIGFLALRLTEPNLYLLDEPTNHLDIAGQERLEAEILMQRATCVIVSHDRAFVQAIATRYLLIDRGGISEIDSPEPFYRTLIGETDGTRAGR